MLKDEFANELLGKTFFEKATEPSEDHWKCKECGATIKKVKGWTNLSNHVRMKHNANYRDIMRAELGGSNAIAQPRLKLLFSWFDLLVEESLPLTTEGRPVIIKYGKLRELSNDVFLKYLFMLLKATHDAITAKLPSKFGIVLNQWQHQSNTFVSVFVVFTSLRGGNQCVLLDTKALPTASVDTSQHLITATLAIYGKSLNDVLFAVADPVGLHPCLMAELNVPIIGCASEKFAIAVQKLLSTPTIVAFIEKIRQIMMLLNKTMSSRSKLAQYTSLAPVLPEPGDNTATYRMLLRYNDIQSIVETNREELQVDQKLLLNRREKEEFDKTITTMPDLLDCALALLSPELTINKARDILDAVVEDYPAMQADLSVCATKPGSQALESGVVAVLNCELMNTLTPAQVEALEPFKVARAGAATAGSSTTSASGHANQTIDTAAAVHILSSTLQSNDSRRNYVEAVSERKKLRKVEADSTTATVYQDLAYIPCTSRLSERVFAATGHKLQTVANSMPISMFEMLLYLKCNRLQWGMSSFAPLKLAFGDIAGSEGVVSIVVDNENVKATTTDNSSSSEK